MYTKFVSLISSDPIIQTLLPLTPAGEICDIDGNCVDPQEDELFKLTTKDGTLTLEREKVGRRHYCWKFRASERRGSPVAPAWMCGRSYPVALASPLLRDAVPLTAPGTEASHPFLPGDGRPVVRPRAQVLTPC